MSLSVYTLENEYYKRQSNTQLSISNSAAVNKTILKNFENNSKAGQNILLLWNINTSSVFAVADIPNQNGGSTNYSGFTYANIFPFTSAEYMESAFPYRPVASHIATSSWNYPIKATCYIDIPKEGIYTMTNSQSYWAPLNMTYSIQINNIPIFSKNRDGDNNYFSVYLKQGTYLFTYDVIYPKSSTLSDYISSYQNPYLKYTGLSGSVEYYLVSSLVKTKYSLLTTLTGNRKNALSNFCKSDKLAITGNVCDTSLQNTNELNDNVINYCYPNGGNMLTDATTGVIDPTCNTLLTKSNLNADIKTALNAKLKANYCNIKNPITNKYYYETDNALCSTYVPELSTGRCLDSSGNYLDESYCNTYNDSTINSTNTNDVKITKARIAKMKKDFMTSATDSTNKYTNSKITNDSSYNFATGKYGTYNNRNITDELLTNPLLSFCETNDPNYLTNSQGQCYGIYNMYKNENVIKNSRQNMRKQVCRDPVNISTNTEDNYTTNAYGCKDLIFDTHLPAISDYKDAIYNYCNTGSNIDSDPCKTYYNRIEDVVLTELGIKSTN